MNRVSRFEDWPALLQSIRSGRFTPIVGPGLAEPLMGSSRELAARWAEAYRCPLADREDLPQVAQYLVMYQDSYFPREELEGSLRALLCTRHPEAITKDMSEKPLDELLLEVSAWRSARGQPDSFALLAGLPLPLYITTAVDRLIEQSLAMRGLAPVSAVFQWQSEDDGEEWVADLRPDLARPLVYHLYGRLDARDAMVLTEDDYFAFLLGMTRGRDLIPLMVRRALADSVLLLLGFHMEDWHFRVMLHSIKSLQGGSRRKRYAHIVAQIDPQQGRPLDPERARRYIAMHFGDIDITIYWGSANDFLHELHARLIERAT